MEKFLIIQTAYPGDVILATSLIEKIHNFFKNSKIDFLLRKGNEDILKDHPYINKIYTWDKKNNKYKNLFKIWRNIRKKNYDVVINLQRFASTGFITWFSKAQIFAGFSKNPFAFAFTHAIPHTIKKGVHEIHRIQDLIEFISDKTYYKPKLYPSDSDYEYVNQFKKINYYCIAPSSVWYTKQFPKERWIEFINKIENNNKIYLIGGKADYNLCEEIKNNTKNPNVINLAGSLSFLQTAALMKDAKMNFTNDSAPLHIASAMNAPITAIFCSTIPDFGFGPLSDNSFITQVDNLPCRPCGLHGKTKCPKKHFRCAYEINIDTLLSRL